MDKDLEFYGFTGMVDTDLEYYGFTTYEDTNNMHVYRVMFYLPNARVTSRMLGIVHLICLAWHLLRHRFSPPPFMGACMSRLSYAFAGPC